MCKYYSCSGYIFTYNMTMNKDYYQILGIKKTSSEAEVKKAYKKLAMQWHPDRHQ